MTARSRTSATGWTDPDDAPDLTQSPFREKMAAAPVRRGRPPAQAPKERLTIRLDPDIVARFKADGPGWQSRINAALRAWMESR